MENLAAKASQSFNPNNSEVIEGLQKVLASSYVFLLKKQNYHWNVKGPLFYSIHNLLEEQYNDLFTAIDEIAERITALGGYAAGSFEDYKNLSVVKEETNIGVSAEDMLRNLVNDEENYISLLHDAIELADDADDEPTEDMLIARKQVHQKNKWMLESLLG
jgi:starvation-inducible DNA-binding protein